MSFDDKIEEEGKKKWYAVYTKPRTEKVVLKNLEEKKIETYLPIQQVISIWKDRKKKIDKVLFTSYIFVKINKIDFLNVQKTNGVVKFVTLEKKPCPIPDLQIEAIKNILEGNYDFVTENKKFKIGENVEISSGSLKGLKGKLIDYKGKSKVVISIDTIGMSLLLETNAFNINICLS
jgi:transcriptional antiterminator RfaH